MLLNMKIDISKLTRDYSKFPVLTKNKSIKSEVVPKQDLIYLYIELNLSQEEVSNFLQCSKRKVRRMLGSYHIIKDRINCQKVWKQNYIDKHGISHHMKNPENVIKIQNTIIKNYGVDNISKLPDHNIKSKITCIKKYGVDNYNKTEECKRKIIITKKRNKNFGKSKEEDTIYKLLLTKFKKVERQYQSEKYPFACDFYIPELDLYIEYQGYVAHGKEPFNPSNKNHIEILNFYHKKELERMKIIKKLSQYTEYIKTWTISDPLKRETAKKNNLNYLEFFNMKQFMEWFNNLT